MRNLKSAYLFTNNNIWKLVFISIINVVSIPSSLNTTRTNKQTHNNQVLIIRALRSRSIRDLCSFMLDTTQHN